MRVHELLLPDALGCQMVQRQPQPTFGPLANPSWNSGKAAMLAFRFVGMVWPFESRSVLGLSRSGLTVAGGGRLSWVPVRRRSARRRKTANDCQRFSTEKPQVWMLVFAIAAGQPCT